MERPREPTVLVAPSSDTSIGVTLASTSKPAAMLRTSRNFHVVSALCNVAPPGDLIVHGLLKPCGEDAVVEVLGGRGAQCDVRARRPSPVP